VENTPADHKLKIYISGHGNTGSQYITDDSGTRKQTVDDLTNLLSFALSERATSWEASKNTEVNMISCLFGRTTDGSLEHCPAVRLHKQLTIRNVYVDLVARTEIINTTSGVHKSKTLLDYKMKVMASNPKNRFSKIRGTYLNGAPVVLLRDYWAEDNLHINSETLEGERILWADHVVNKFVDYIQPSIKSSGFMQVADAREKELHDLVFRYDQLRDPADLKGRMEAVRDKISDHRSLWGKATSTKLPRTARLITDLLSKYPG
jgi:hypothetical protein